MKVSDAFGSFLIGLLVGVPTGAFSAILLVLVFSHSDVGTLLVRSLAR